MFDVESGQVWIDAEGVAWKVANVGTYDTTLERTVTDLVPTRDLVRSHRLMNDTHPTVK
jgi:hypothetical protein